MSAPSARVTLSLDELLEAVNRLPPAQKREFERRMAARRSDSGQKLPDESNLVRAAKVRLSAADDRRLKRLISRSERGLLTRDELAEYQTLAQKVQRLDAARVEALAKLARHRGTSLRTVKGEIGREGGADGT